MPDFTYKAAPAASETPLDLKLYYTGSETCMPGHAWGPGVKDHYKIHIVHHGQGVFRTSGQTYRLTAGQGFLIVPGQLSYYEADAESPWTYSWVAFNGAYAEHYLDTAGFSAEHPVFDCLQDDAIQACIRHIQEIDKGSPSKELRLQAALCTFLAILMDSNPTGPGLMKSESLKETYIARMIEYMEMNYSRTFRIEELAGELGLNRKYMSKLFKDAVGVSPQAYVFQYRLNKAREMMRTSSFSISEISSSVGYKDPLLFSRMFKKTFGISPSRYRQS